jgi:AcrR family transcriptional regulator
MGKLNAATSGATLDPRIVRSRTAVLEAAAELLIEGGLAALTIDGVQARCGVAKTTVYRQWTNRDELVVDTYLHLAPVLESPDPDLPFEQRLREVIGQLVDVFTSPEWLALYPSLLEAARHSASIQSLRHRMDEHQQEVIDAVVLAGVAEGRLPGNIDVEEARLQLMGPLTMAMIARPEMVDHHLGDRIVDLFLASRTAV